MKEFWEKHKADIGLGILVIYVLSLGVATADEVFGLGLFPTKLDQIIAQTIKLLDSDEKAIRDKATKELIEYGDFAAKQLIDRLASTESGTPEAVGRLNADVKQNFQTVDQAKAWWLEQLDRAIADFGQKAAAAAAGLEAITGMKLSGEQKWLEWQAELLKGMTETKEFRDRAVADLIVALEQNQAKQQEAIARLAAETKQNFTTYADWRSWRQATLDAGQPVSPTVSETITNLSELDAAASKSKVELTELTGASLADPAAWRDWYLGHLVEALLKNQRGGQIILGTLKLRAGKELATLEEWKSLAAAAPDDGKPPPLADLVKGLEYSQLGQGYILKLLKDFSGQAFEDPAQWKLWRVKALAERAKTGGAADLAELKKFAGRDLTGPDDVAAFVAELETAPAETIAADLPAQFAALRAAAQAKTQAEALKNFTANAAYPADFPAWLAAQEKEGWLLKDYVSPAEAAAIKNFDDQLKNRAAILYCLKQITGQNFETLEQWRKWYDSYKEML